MMTQQMLVERGTVSTLVFYRPQVSILGNFFYYSSYLTMIRYGIPDYIVLAPARDVIISSSGLCSPKASAYRNISRLRGWVS